jgi:hypothetical protein
MPEDSTSFESSLATIVDGLVENIPEWPTGEDHLRRAYRFLRWGKYRKADPLLVSGLEKLEASRARLDEGGEALFSGVIEKTLSRRERRAKNAAALVRYIRFHALWVLAENTRQGDWVKREADEERERWSAEISPGNRKDAVRRQIKREYWIAVARAVLATCVIVWLVWPSVWMVGLSIGVCAVYLFFSNWNASRSPETPLMQYLHGVQYRHDGVGFGYDATEALKAQIHHRIALDIRHARTGNWPTLETRDPERVSDIYVAKLGFCVVERSPETITLSLAAFKLHIRRADVERMLPTKQMRSMAEPPGSSFVLYIPVPDVEVHFSVVRDADPGVQSEIVNETGYLDHSVEAFYIDDPNGHRLCFYLDHHGPYQATDWTFFPEPIKARGST